MINARPFDGVCHEGGNHEPLDVKPPEIDEIEIRLTEADVALLEVLAAYIDFSRLGVLSFSDYSVTTAHHQVVSCDVDDGDDDDLEERNPFHYLFFSSFQHVIYCHHHVDTWNAEIFWISWFDITTASMQSDPILEVRRQTMYQNSSESMWCIVWRM